MEGVRKNDIDFRLTNIESEDTMAIACEAKSERNAQGAETNDVNDRLHFFKVISSKNFS